MLKIGLVVPVYNYFDYAADALLSLLQEDSVPCQYQVVVVNDASPEWTTETSLPLLSALKTLKNHNHVCELYSFEVNQGLTYGWNFGLRTLFTKNCDYICVTNSDVLFSKDWWVPLVRGIEDGYALTGPLTNAPGTEQKQQVKLYIKDYEPSDLKEHINQTAQACLQLEPYIETPLNGFCLFSSQKHWQENAYDSEFVFRPKNLFNSRNQPNPTPLMTLNEYELQSRWHEKGLKFACCCRSFVFHYRSVSRGLQFAKGQQYRKC